MNTFEEEFGRSPTQEDFNIQAHALESLLHGWTATWRTEGMFDGDTMHEIRKTIKRLRE